MNKRVELTEAEVQRAQAKVHEAEAERDKLQRELDKVSRDLDRRKFRNVDEIEQALIKRQARQQALELAIENASEAVADAAAELQAARAADAQLRHEQARNVLESELESAVGLLGETAEAMGRAAGAEKEMLGYRRIFEPGAISLLQLSPTAAELSRQYERLRKWHAVHYAGE